MKLIKTENLRMTRTVFHEVPDEDIVEEFGSIEKFKEAMEELSPEFEEFIDEYPSDEYEDDIDDRHFTYEWGVDAE
jgi:hypothetical protein